MDLLERLTVLISSDVSDVVTYKWRALLTIDTIYCHFKGRAMEVESLFRLNSTTYMYPHFLPKNFKTLGEKMVTFPTKIKSSKCPVRNDNSARNANPKTPLTTFFPSFASWNFLPSGARCGVVLVFEMRFHSSNNLNGVFSEAFSEGGEINFFSFTEVVAHFRVFYFFCITSQSFKRTNFKDGFKKLIQASMCNSLLTLAAYVR